MPIAESVKKVLAAIAPGTELRSGLDRILRGRTGALIVLGHSKAIDALCSGGFEINIAFSAQRLRELAKMDGAVILDTHATRIVRAGVQLLPDRNIETSESGTRHRTAERVAKQTGHAVISVSQSMRIIGIYVGNHRHLLADTSDIEARANQAIATLERYKNRLDEVSQMLLALEIEDLVTVRDVIVVLQRAEMVRRIVEEVDVYIIELGTDGRLMAMQLADLVSGIGKDATLVRRDYQPSPSKRRDDPATELAGLSSNELLDIGCVAKATGLPSSTDGLNQNLSPRGYRILNRIPRLPAAIIERLVAHFHTVQSLLGATPEELMQVEGVGEQRAHSIRENLSRIAESSILDRYV